MGGDSCSEGCRFESQCRILDGHCMTVSLPTLGINREVAQVSLNAKRPFKDSEMIILHSVRTTIRRTVARSAMTASTVRLRASATLTPLAPTVSSIPNSALQV